MERQQAVKLVQGNASNYYNDLREKIIKSLGKMLKLILQRNTGSEKVLKYFIFQLKKFIQKLLKLLRIIKLEKKLETVSRFQLQEKLMQENHHY